MVSMFAIWQPHFDYFCENA